MPDAQSLKILVELEAGQAVAGFDSMTSKIAADTKTMAASFANATTAAAQCAARFLESGMSAEQASGALVGLGYSAKEAASTMQSLGLNAEVTAAKLGGLERAEAMATARIGAMSMGMGMAGSALGRVASYSETLAPLMQAAFPVVVIGAVIDMFLKIPDLIGSITDKMAGWDKVAQSTYDHLIEGNRKVMEQNVHLADQIEGVNLIGAEGAAKYGLAAKDNADSVARWSAFSAELLRQQISIRAQIDELQHAAPSTVPGAELANEWWNRTSVTIERLQKQLEGIDSTEMGVVQHLKELSQVEPLKIGAERAKANEEDQEKAERSNTEYDRTMADHDLAEFNRRRELADREERLEEEVNATMLRMALKDLAEFERIQNQKAETAIRSQEEVFRQSQKGAEQGLKVPQLQAQLMSAGAPQQVKSILDAKAIQQESVIVAEALAEAKLKTAEFAEEMASLNTRMQEVAAEQGTSSEAYAELESQLQQVTRMYDAAADATQKWANTQEQLNVKLRQANPVVQTMGNAEKAIQSGFDSFNSGFLRMITSGQSFVHVMQRAWTSMAESFITSVLQMGEKWVMQHLVMAAADKLMEAMGLSVHLTTTTAKIAATKAEAAAEAGLAGASGVASMAAAPFPIDLGAPAFGASMMAAAMGYAGFAQGGIVTANLHPGEMVLPARLSTFVQTAAASASAKSGGTMPGMSPSHPIHFHFAPNLSAVNRDGVAELLSEHGDAFFQNVRQKLRRMGYNQ